MKFQRTTRVINGSLDAASWLCVLFPLVFFALLHHFLVVPSGTRLSLPGSPMLEAAARRGESVEVLAIDASDRIYFRHQIVPPEELASRLKAAQQDPAAPSVLVIQPHRFVTWERLSEISGHARVAGWSNLILSATASPSGTR